MWVIEVNNQVVFAAAGHGKTYSLCSQAKTAIDNTNKHVLRIGDGQNEKLEICTGYYAQFRDVLIMQRVELDREVVNSIKINVNAMFSLI